MSHLFLMSVPVISTAHMPSSSALGELDGLVSQYDAGGFVHIEEDLVEGWMAPVQKWSQKHGFAWVRFDADAEQVPDLPVFDWDASEQDHVAIEKLAVNEYVADGGNHCPHCDSTNLTTVDQMQVDGPTAAQTTECGDCGAHWNDVYTLTGFADLEVAAN